jgi:hypothetical protein
VNNSAKYCAGFSGFHHLFLKFSEKKAYLLTANKCGLTITKPGLNLKKPLVFWFIPGFLAMVFLFFQKNNKKTWFKPEKPGLSQKTFPTA